MVSARGGKHGFVYANRQDVYRAIRRRGLPKNIAAAIANEGHTYAGRSRMAAAASRTRRRRS